MVGVCEAADEAKVVAVEEDLGDGEGEGGDRG